MPVVVPDCLTRHPEVAEAYLRLQARQRKHQGSRLRLAVCGIYNAGKSSLLNMLAGQHGEQAEAFRTSAARQTSRVLEKRFGEVVYIDTPGVDGAQGDDDLAWSGLLAADGFLYAHRLSATEFERREIEFLGLLRQQVAGLKDRLALVITQVDEIADEADAQARQAAILAAFQKAAGFKPRQVFLVSSRRFAKGMQENKPALVVHSGIPPLKAWVDELAGPQGQARWLDFRQQSLETERAALRTQLEAIAAAVKKEHDSRARAQARHTQAFTEAAAALTKKIRAAVRRIDAAA